MKYQPNRRARTPVQPTALEETPLAGLTSEKRLPSAVREETAPIKISPATAAKIRRKVVAKA